VYPEAGSGEAMGADGVRGAACARVAALGGSRNGEAFSGTAG
jgi:hypothetical protein